MLSISALFEHKLPQLQQRKTRAVLTGNITTSSLYSLLIIYFVITKSLLLPGVLVKRLWLYVEENNQHDFLSMLCDVQYLVPFCFGVFGYEEAATVSLNISLRTIIPKTSLYKLYIGEYFCRSP